LFDLGDRGAIRTFGTGFGPVLQRAAESGTSGALNSAHSFTEGRGQVQRSGPSWRGIALSPDHDQPLAGSRRHVQPNPVSRRCGDDAAGARRLGLKTWARPSLRGPPPISGSELRPTPKNGPTSFEQPKSTSAPAGTSASGQYICVRSFNRPATAERRLMARRPILSPCEGRAGSVAIKPTLEIIDRWLAFARRRVNLGYGNYDDWRR
jgi:hypothetical protein